VWLCEPSRASSSSVGCTERGAHAAAGKKGGEGMCTVQKDYMQGRGKSKKGAGAGDEDDADLKGKIFDRCADAISVYV